MSRFPYLRLAFVVLLALSALGAAQTTSFAGPVIIGKKAETTTVKPEGKVKESTRTGPKAEKPVTRTKEAWKDKEVSKEFSKRSADPAKLKNLLRKDTLTKKSEATPNAYRPGGPRWARLLSGAAYPKGLAKPFSFPKFLPPRISMSSAIHILWGDTRGGGGHLWPGKPGKTPFPKDWSAGKILDTIGEIAADKSVREHIQKGDGRIVKEAVVEGVNVKVILEPPSKGGGVVTGHPTNLRRNGD